MNAFFIYLFKAGGWIAVWWLIYHFFLRKEKFYTFNRVYLMTGLAASLLIPLVKFHYPVEIFMPQTPAVTIAENTPAPAQSIDNWAILFYIYIFSLALLIVRQLFLFLKIRNIIRSAGYTILNNYRLVNFPDTKTTFSFFNYIFFNLRQISDTEKQLILAHERSHIFQRHWIDLALAESVCILLWFNPFMWFYRHSIKENHEYLADEAVIRNGYSSASYRAVLINQSLNTSVFPLVNSFTNYKFKRIIMMKKETSNPLKKLAVMLLLPAACFFFWAFSEPEYHVTTVESAVTINNEPDKNEVVIVANQNANKSTVDSTVKVNRVQGKILSVSVFKDSIPLYIIDGKEVSSLEEINPKQIESVKVLKDASAVKIYGEKGKNGVIIVTTKKIEPVANTAEAAEVIQVSGIVTGAEDGKPLSGVAVIVKGTTTGTVTDMEGKYSLNAPANAALQFSFIDMPTQEVNVSNVQEINVSMGLNGNIQPISLTLQGKVTETTMVTHKYTTRDNHKAGVNVNNPLFIVDGKEVSTLENIDPYQIESVSILKDASAVEIYGEKGKNGVVIITIKKVNNSPESQ